MHIENVYNSKGAFFRILQETKLSQVGVMTLAPGKDSGPREIHSGDQLVYVIEGEAGIDIGNENATVRSGDVVIIPQGVQHRITGSGATDLFFLTVYTPPQY